MYKVWIGLGLLIPVAAAGSILLIYRLLTSSQEAPQNARRRSNESPQSRTVNDTNLPQYDRSSKSDENADKDNCLTTNDLKEILDKLWDVRTKWFDIGIQLSLKVSDLDAIKLSNNNKPGDCFREMLTHRLRQLPGASWENLLCALSLETVGYCSFAESIRKQLNINSESLK